jgi:hypothetical protein
LSVGLDWTCRLAWRWFFWALKVCLYLFQNVPKSRLVGLVFFGSFQENFNPVY